jgi:predicted MFS family arabinose efflux permease
VSSYDPLDPREYDAILEEARQRRSLWLRVTGSYIRTRLPVSTRGAARYVLAIFYPLACGYLLSYLFRNINGPIADQLITQFSLNPGSLGLLTSAYFLAFALSAIPIGIALDAVGPRHVQGWLMAVAALWALAFAFAPSMIWLAVGRTLIGIGVAGGLMAGLKANALWVSPRYLPLANGSLVMFGGLGAVVSTWPIEMLDELVGWRWTFLILALLSSFVSATVFALVPECPRNNERGHWRDAFSGIVNTVGNRQFLQLAPLSASVVGTAFAVHGLWAARWLTDVDQVSTERVLTVLLAMGIGLTVGAPLIGAADTFLVKARVPQSAIFGTFCMMFMILELLVVYHAHVPLVLLWGLIGAFGGMTVLSYSILDSMFPAGFVGRANSVLNLLHLTTAWGVQYAMGAIIAAWTPGTSGHYPLIAYRSAFVLPILLQIAGFSWFLKGTHKSSHIMRPRARDEEPQQSAVHQ